MLRPVLDGVITLRSEKKKYAHAAYLLNSRETRDWKLEKLEAGILFFFVFH